MISKEIFGIPILTTTYDEVLENIDTLMNENKQHVLSDINIANLMLLRTNPIIRKFVFESDLIVPDGLSIVWASKLIGRSLRSRIAGCDLFQKLIAFGSTKRYRFYLLGAREEIVKRVKYIFETTYPNLNIAGIRNGYFNIDNENEIVEQINESKANILILGFSSPKREEFILRNKGKLINIRLIQGVGGSFDVVAGYVQRAPHWMQQFGLEWFFRFMQEPRRLWKRYLITNTLFVFLLIKEIAIVRTRYFAQLLVKSASRIGEL